MAGANLVATAAVASQPPVNPGAKWKRFPNPEAAGFGSSALQALEHILYSKPTTSLMVVRAGRIAYSYGDISRTSNVASVRKSILSMLYGKYVANGRIDLDRTIGQLGIDESGEGLMPIEKTATIRHILTSSSGVYWPAGSPGGNEATPPRGSKKPGSYFLYNNWDFNVAGAVFEQLSGKTVFQALADDLAAPLEFEDFDLTRQKMVGYHTNPSRYKSYQMFLSPRDLARLGLLMVNGGVWNGRQIIPAEWVLESTTLHWRAADMHSRRGQTGYAYMWWKPSEGRRGPEWADSYLAYGKWGQMVLGLPAIDTVIVHQRAVTDEFAIAYYLGATAMAPAGGEFTDNDFLALADIILAARI